MDPDSNRYSIHPKMLDSDLESMNLDPKHYCQNGSLDSTGLDPDSIRSVDPYSDSGCGIRIRDPDPDPGGRK